MNKKLLFDFNGTLVNTNEAQFRSWDKTFKKFYLEKKLFIYVIHGINDGVSSFHIASRITNKKELIKELIKSKRLYFQSEIQNNYKLFDNQLNLLELLSKTYNLYILSLANKGHITQWLLNNNLNLYFKGIYARNNITQNIDKNCLIKRFIIAHDIPSFYIGDTKEDERIAKINNISFLKFCGEDKTYSGVNSNKSEKSFNNYKELFNYIITNG